MKQIQVLALASLLALFVASCATIRHADEAKDEVAPVAVPELAAEVSRVNLIGFQLPDFVDFALTNRPEMISAALAVEDRLLAIRTVESGQSTGNGGSHFSWHNSGRFTGSVGLELLLLDFGRYDASHRAACEDLAAAELTFAETRLAVFEEVATSYFTLLRNDALLDVARTNEWECLHHLTQATNRFANGEAKLLDVLRARLDLSEAVQSRIAASNNTVTAGAEFLRALGLSADRSSREEVLVPLPDGLGAALKEFDLSTFSVEEALAHARTNSPALMV